MISIFTIPKPFIGLDDIHQRNAIQSWLAIRPECEIILCGNDQGVAEAANKFGVVHIPDIPVNEFGTPYLDTAFEKVEREARHEVLCYVNSDIIFFDDIIKAIGTIHFKKFLIVGRRWNMNIDEILNFKDVTSILDLREESIITSQLSNQRGSDYFIFKKGSIGQIPNFLVGRPYWDNWMIYNARIKRIPVIDASKMIVDVHQNHNYLHVSHGHDNSWHGPEGETNEQFVGREKNFDLWDSTHILNRALELERASGIDYLKRKVQRLDILDPKTGTQKKWQKLTQRFLLFLISRCKKVSLPILEKICDIFLDPQKYSFQRNSKNSKLVDNEW